MTRRMQPRRNGSYGIDAPYLLPIPTIVIVANIFDGVNSRTIWPFAVAGLVMASAACGLYASRAASSWSGQSCSTSSPCAAMSKFWT